MKAITILQPWASLIAIGAKRFETRSWPTSYRGPIAIHAGKSWPDAVKNNEISEHIHKALCWKGGFGKFSDIPRGSVIAIADLVECWAIDGYGHSLNWHPGVNDTEEKHYYAYPSSLIGKTIMPTDFKLISYPETVFGYYPNCGFRKEPRFAWELANVRLIDPVPARGMQRIWNWEGEHELIYRN